MQETIIFYGDSNTFGFNSAGYSGGGFRGTFFRREDTWVGRLAAEQDLAGYRVVNLGENGRTIPENEWEKRELAEMLRTCAPVRLTGVMLGSNDLLTMFRCDRDKLSLKMGRLIEFLLELPEIRCDGSRILLIAPTQTQLPEYREEEALLNRLSEAFGETYRALAERYGTYFADAAQWGIPLSSDGVHFTKEGHRIFAENMHRVISEILAAR